MFYLNTINKTIAKFVAGFMILLLIISGLGLTSSHADTMQVADYPNNDTRSEERRVGKECMFLQ